LQYLFEAELAKLGFNLHQPSPERIQIASLSRRL